MRSLKSHRPSSYRNAIEPGPSLEMPSAITAKNSSKLPVNHETGLREAGSYRHVIHDSQLALIENSSVSALEPAPGGFESKHQIILPYFGLFDYQVGPKSALVDTNCTLFVSPDREYQDVHPLEGIGHAGLVINPALPLLDEICSKGGASAFQDLSRPSTPQLRLLTHYMLRTFPVVNDPLYADEWTIAALREALSATATQSGRASRVVDQAKMILHDRGCERLALSEIAREVGVTGVYLTQEFTRVEGIPLYRYQLQLRLNRALLELPHCDDITRLALDLGFSSHSHFTSTFRRCFGVTPSGFRLGRMPRETRQAIARAA